MQQDNNSKALTVEAIVRQFKLFFIFQEFPFTGHDGVQFPRGGSVPKSKILKSHTALRSGPSPPGWGGGVRTTGVGELLSVVSKK